MMQAGNRTTQRAREHKGGRPDISGMLPEDHGVQEYRNLMGRI